MRVSLPTTLRSTYGQATLATTTAFVFTQAGIVSATCATLGQWGNNYLHPDIAGDGANFKPICKTAATTNEYDTTFVAIASYVRIYNQSGGNLDYHYVMVYM